MVWIPTRQGAVLIFLLLVLLVFGAGSCLYSLLSPTNPHPDPSFLIIEGWLPDSAIEEIITRRHPGQRIITTGGPITFGNSLIEQNNYADLSVARLLVAGERAENILSAPAPLAKVDRTYASALAVRRVLEEQGLYGQACDLYSFGPHSRRSLYMYRKALGRKYPIGIVALESTEYDMRRWWANSHAFKTTLGEVLSLTHAYCAFWKYRGECVELEVE